MKKERVLRAGVVGAVLLTVSSCWFQRYPKAWVPDDKVVFLMQKTELQPIRYDTVAADPYEFAGYTGPIDKVHPSFLGSLSFGAVQKPDFAADSKLYQEVNAHAEYIMAMPLLAELRTKLDASAAAGAAPQPGITKGDGWRKIATPQGELEYLTAPSAQYHLRLPGGPEYMLFVLDETGPIRECAVWNKAGVRFDWFPDGSYLTARLGVRAVEIDADLSKQLKTVTETNLNWLVDKTLAVYLPAGIRLTSLDGGGFAHADIVPAWPEGYQRRTIGPFDLLFTTKDAAAVDALDAARLTTIESQVRQLTGLGATSRRVILIPPDLESYRRLCVDSPGQVLTWYPAGFETLDYITMWPPSVPRYRLPAGQAYFMNEEFYEIVAHEYTHVLEEENTGIFSPVPAWLMEGLAVWVECRLFPDAREYWDATFTVAKKQQRLMSWVDVTKYGTGSYPVATARIEYAQSYAMLDVLEKKWGADKVASYLRSFRVAFSAAAEVRVAQVFQPNFHQVFGVPWTDAVALVEQGDR